MTEQQLFLTDDLAIDYQFTFNLSKSDDKHFTAINFKNEPTKMDVDVEFSISCSVAAKVQPPSIINLLILWDFATNFIWLYLSCSVACRVGFGHAKLN